MSRIPIHALSSPALPPPRLQAPSSRVAVVDLVEHAEQHASPRRIRADAGSSSLGGVAACFGTAHESWHTNHGTRRRRTASRGRPFQGQRACDAAASTRMQRDLQFSAHVQAHDHGLHVLDRICSWLKRRSTSQPPSGRVDGIVRRPCCVGSESMMRCTRSAACIRRPLLHAWNLHDERSHGEAGVSETSGAR